MTGADYCFSDPRVVLIPPEHLTRRGMTRAFAAILAAHAGWQPERVDFFDRAFGLYWERSRVLAHAGWLPPRLRHVALVREPLAVLPYVQLLNTSAWTLYECDFDPTVSDVELAAYLLSHGDRMAATGEATMVAVQNAAWWFERTDEECAAFAAAASRSPRPDAAAFQALAAALPWLRRLRHERLRPPLLAIPHRRIPGTGLLVPKDIESEPPALVQAWTTIAKRTVARHRAHWRSTDPSALHGVCEWLMTDLPPLLVTDRGRIVWDPATPDRLGALRSVLKQADAIATRAVQDDLEVVARHTRAFRAAVVEAAALPAPAEDLEPGGYTYIDRRRGMIAYDLRDEGIERLQGPDLPYARLMLGARTAHEWGHLAASAGWVPRTVSDERYAELVGTLADLLEQTIERSPARVRLAAQADLDRTAAGRPRGPALAELLVGRVADYQANLVAWRFMSAAERETYVRHNVRTLRPFFARGEIWRMLVRYLYEYQYLGLSDVEDTRTYFLRSTWFDVDFMDSGILDERQFDELARASGDLCACHAIDPARIRPPD